MLPRPGAPRAELPAWVEPAPDWAERVAAAHAEGYAVVAGAIEWEGGLAPPAAAGARRRTSPGPAGSRTSRIRCSARRCSTASSSSGSRTSTGLPAFAAPADEPWLYDGRIVLDAEPAAVGVELPGRSELDRDPVVDAAEDVRAERERDDRRDREVDRRRRRAARAPSQSVSRTA